MDLTDAPRDTVSKTSDRSLSTRAKLIRDMEQARRLFYGEIKNNFM
ncbi:MAG: hypothetical protein SXA11_08400 [Cyanobacteriota bacterium]|nr:hypothetical protein [Cyanobacteriota bacterium]